MCTFTSIDIYYIYVLVCMVHYTNHMHQSIHMSFLTNGMDSGFVSPIGPGGGPIWALTLANGVWMGHQHLSLATPWGRTACQGQGSHGGGKGCDLCGWQVGRTAEDLQVSSTPSRPPRNQLSDTHLNSWTGKKESDSWCSWSQTGSVQASWLNSSGGWFVFLSGGSFTFHVGWSCYEVLF